MSHFTVLVFGPDHEKQLAPFEESTAGLPKELLTFVDTEEEYRKEYEEDTSLRYRDPKTGTLYVPWDDRFRVAGTFGTGTGTHVKPDGWEEIQVPFKNLFPTFESYVEGWHDSKDRDPENGRYGYWKNPNAKWDWYVVGGRWTGFFKLKPGRSGTLGRPGAGDNRAKFGWVDSARKRDIDFEGMRSDKAAERLAVYNRVHAVIAGRPVVTWEESLKRFSDNVVEAREFYWKQPVLEDLQKYKLVFFDLEDYLFSVGEFEARERKRAVTTFAVLKDGKWYERGEMGWWACVHNEKDEEKWFEEYSNLLDAVPPDTLLTLIDCHI